MSKKRKASKPRSEKAEAQADSRNDQPLKIDMVVSAREWKADSPLPPAAFHYFRRYNLMKFKIEPNRLTMADLQNLQACGWLYMAQEGLTKPEELTLTALVHHFTPEIRGVLWEFGFEEDEPGIFRRDSEIPIYVLAVENLPEELVPKELQVFSKRV
jgi:hypothetical protein